MKFGRPVKQSQPFNREIKNFKRILEVNKFMKSVKKIIKKYI